MSRKFQTASRFPLPRVSSQCGVPFRALCDHSDQSNSVEGESPSGAGGWLPRIPIAPANIRVWFWFNEEKIFTKRWSENETSLTSEEERREEETSIRRPQLVQTMTSQCSCQCAQPQASRSQLDRFRSRHCQGPWDKTEGEKRRKLDLES